MNGKRVEKRDSVKRALINARNTIRKKFNELHNRRLNFNYQINEEYKPITGQLKKLVEFNTVKKESEGGPIKKEEPDTNSRRKSWPKATYSTTGWPSTSLYKTAKAKRRGKAGRSHRKNADEFFSAAESESEEEEEEGNVSGVATMEKSDDESVDNDVLPDAESVQQRRVRINLFDAKSTEENLVRSIEKRKILDTLYGFRVVDNRLLLGDAVVKVKGEDPNLTYEVNGRQFPITPGLTHLLLETVPRQDSYNDNDLEIYKDMIVHTNAHKTGYKRTGGIKRHVATPKYNKILKLLFPPKRRPTFTGDGIEKFAGKRGGGCMKKPQMSYKTVNKMGKFNYTYWDDPNELVDRLRILMSSKSVGHTGHENEMISIVEELREAKIIK